MKEVKRVRPARPGAPSRQPRSCRCRGRVVDESWYRRRAARSFPLPSKGHRATATQRIDDTKSHTFFSKSNPKTRQSISLATNREKAGYSVRTAWGLAEVKPCEQGGGHELSILNVTKSEHSRNRSGRVDDRRRRRPREGRVSPCEHRAGGRGTTALECYQGELFDEQFSL